MRFRKENLQKNRRSLALSALVAAYNPSTLSCMTTTDRVPHPSRICDGWDVSLRPISTQSFSQAPTAHLPLHLHLPLQVSAVILNAVKDPEEFHPPQPLEPFQAILFPSSSLLLYGRDCFFFQLMSHHFDRGSSSLVSCAAEKSASPLNAHKIPPHSSKKKWSRH
jgi:hypothetical protein